MSQKNMILLSGSGDTVAWFRLELLDRFIDSSYKVFVLAPDIRLDLKAELDNRGIQFITIKLERKGFGVFNLVRSIFELIQIFRTIKPDLIFSYTHKAILSGSLAAKIAGFSNLYSLITGTGHLFDDNTPKEKLTKYVGSKLLTLALKFNSLIFFQNPDDQELFLANNITQPSKARLVNGSGVNLNKFTPQRLPSSPIFLCMARLIKSKGLLEYARSAREVKKLHPEARFLLYGYPDNHPDSIDENEIINHWHEEYGVEYYGYTSNPKEAIGNCSVFVLLSYKEGTPRVVLEAMAMARPIVTTNTPGCRETVLDGVNGFLVPKYDHIETAQAMTKLLKKDLRNDMGLASRDFCESKFNVFDVNQYLLKEMKVLQ